MNEEQRKTLLARIRKGWPECEVCNAPILLGRLEAIPETTRCAKHSNEGRYIGVPNFSHKTAPEVSKVKMDPDVPGGGESVRQLMRGYRRGR